MSAEHRDSTDFQLASVGATTTPIDTHSISRLDAGPVNSRLSRVLLVSDDVALREQVSRIIGDRYILIAIDHGATANEALRPHRPDLMLLDELSTPRENREFLARLRADPQLHSLPVIQFSATGDEADHGDDSAPQPDDYLFKPVAARPLLARVENQLQLARLKTELEQSRARLVLAAGVASLGTWEYDLTSKEFCCDAHVTRLLGIANPASATRPFSWSNFASAPDRGRVDAAFRKACETGAAYQVDFCVEHADGTKLWLSCSGQILDVRGRRRMAGIVKDATERHLAVEKAATSDARYHDLLKNANSAIFRWSCDGTINYVNEFALDFFGYREEEVLGRNVDMFVPERESTGVDLVRLAKDVVAHPERYLTNVNENICRDGTRVWMNWTNRALRDEQGHVTEIISVGSDVTERRRAAEALQESKAQLEATVDSLVQGVVVCDLEGNLTRWNRAALEMHGFASEADARKTLNEFENVFEVSTLDGEILSVERWPLHRLLRGEQFHDLELRIRHQQAGWSRVFSYRGSLVRRKEGQPFMAIVVINDVTDRRRAEEALYRSEERFELAINAAQEGVWDWNVETGEVFYSRRWKEMLGYTDDEIEPSVSSWQRLLHPDDLDRCVQLVEAVHRGEKEYLIEFRLRHKDGHYVDILSRGLPVRREPGGPFIRIVGTHQDLTQRKQYEAALRQSEQRLAIAASGARIAMFDWNIVTGEASWTEQVVQLLGRTTQLKSPMTTMKASPLSLSFQYHDWAQCLHPDDRERVERQLRHCMQEHLSFESEYRVIWPDGSIHWLAARAVFQYDVDDQPLHMVGILMDITERKLADDALRKSEKLLAADVEAMTRLQKLSALFLRDGDLVSVLTEIVDASIAISGADFGNIQLLDPESGRLKIVAKRGFPEWWVEYWNQNCDGGGACGAALQRCERVIVEDVESSPIYVGADTLEIQRKAGVRAIQSTPLVNRSGRLLGILSTHYRQPCRPDDRALKLVDLLARQSADIIEHARAEASLRHAKAAAETANQAKSQFLAHMSHELRTPMNAILGMVDVALPRATDPTVKDCLRTVKESADLLLMILNDLLDSAKIESGKLELESEPFSLRKTLAGVHQVLMSRASEKGLAFACRIPDTTPDVWIGDRMRLQQVLLNLAGNAVKFTERGRVELHVRSVSHEGRIALEFEVRDTGIGLAPSRLRHVFDPFVQADASMSRRYGGTGLGLSISKGLVDAMGGRIWAESEEGRGSTFRFMVPLPLGTVETIDTETHVLTTAPAATLRVLLVEDNPANQKLATFILQDRGHLVEVACDGLEALRMIEQTRFDVILMDVQMPRMDGLTATAAIREREADGDRVPIVAMTAHAMQGYRERCLAAGMDDYLTKPLDAQEMIRLIETLAAARPRGSRFGANISSTTNSAAPRTIESPVTPAVFDPEVALKRCLNKPQMVREMIQCFFRDMDLLFPQMRAELQQGRLAEVGRLGHRLKGTVVFLGAAPASEAARRVEQFCEPNAGTSLDAEQAVAALERECLELKKALLEFSLTGGKNA